MPLQADVIIARCDVVGRAEDATYRQAITCGRHEMVGDEPAERGGHDAGPAPFEYLLSALGSCTSITLRMYAERKGWKVDSVSVALQVRQGAAGKKIERRVTVSGSLDDAQLGKLAEISERTPVTLVVKSGVDVHTTMAQSSG